MITVYTQPNCRYCDVAKKYLDSQEQDYTEIDVTKDALAKAYIVDAGFQTTPILDIDGELVDGANLKNIQDALFGDVFEEGFGDGEE